MRIARAWIDVAANDWRHEANSYGPDDDDRDTSDDTAEVPIPIYWPPEDDGAQDCGQWFPGDPTEYATTP